jgi:hypothetical protein
VARAEASAAVNKTLALAAREAQRINATVEAAAEKAAAATAKAASVDTIPALRKAALAQVDVQKAMRQADEQRADLVVRLKDDVKVGRAGEGSVVEGRAWHERRPLAAWRGCVATARGLGWPRCC